MLPTGGGLISPTDLGGRGGPHSAGGFLLTAKESLLIMPSKTGLLKAFCLYDNFEKVNVLSLKFLY